MRNRQIAILAGTVAVFATARPAVHAQTTPAPDANAPAAATPPVSAPPASPTPATPTPDNSGTPNPPRPRFRIGPGVGLYLPSADKTRDRFGNTWLSFGVGIGGVSAVTEKGAYALDLNLFYNARGGNHAFFAPLGLGYRVALAPGTNVVPYAGVSGDILFADITSNPENVHNSFQVGGGGSAFTGLTFGDSAYLEARYYLLSSVKSFDLSGLSLTAGYRF